MTGKRVSHFQRLRWWFGIGSDPSLPLTLWRPVLGTSYWTIGGLATVVGIAIRLRLHGTTWAAIVGHASLWMFSGLVTSIVLGGLARRIIRGLRPKRCVVIDAPEDATVLRLFWGSRSSRGHSR